MGRPQTRDVRPCVTHQKMLTQSKNNFVVGFFGQVTCELFRGRFNNGCLGSRQQVYSKEY